MSPRPSRVTDAELLEATAQVVAKNPAGWRLEDVGALVGLSPATIVQRLGSKRNLEVCLIQYLNERGGGVPLVAYKPGDDRHAAGLFAFRLLAALSPDPELASVAGGAA